MRLGAQYHKLWVATAASTLGDGVYLSALPLLAARLTRDPLQVAVVDASSWLPWLLFGLLSGAMVDRQDRRQVMWQVDTSRFVVVAALAVAVVADWVSIPMLAIVGFLLGIGQTLFDSAAQSIIPALLSHDERKLERANSQMIGTQQVGERLAGPPLGGFLFSLANAMPFALDALSFLASSVLIVAVRGRFVAERAGAPTSLRSDIAEGLRWLLGHRLFRTMAAMVSVTNLSLSASFAILVLYAQDELGLASVGFGLLLASRAVGGVLGSVAATRASRFFGVGTVFIGALLIAAGGLVVIGITSNPWVASGAMVVEGLVFAIFTVVSISLRQAVVPDALMGRVVAANRLAALGSIPLGSILGGVLGHTFGLRSPFLLGAAALAAAALLAMSEVNNRAVNAARLEAAVP